MEKNAISKNNRIDKLKKEMLSKGYNVKIEGNKIICKKIRKKRTINWDRVVLCIIILLYILIYLLPLIIYKKRTNIFT